MTAIAAALFWCSTIAQTFLLGFQSLNVNGGRYLAAVATSVALTLTQFVVVRTIATAPAATALALSITAGPLGILAAMAAHRRLFGVRS